MYVLPILCSSFVMLELYLWSFLYHHVIQEISPSNHILWYVSLSSTPCCGIHHQRSFLNRIFRPTVLFTLLCSNYRFQGEIYSDDKFAKRRLGDLPQILCDEIFDRNRFQAHETYKELHSDNITPLLIGNLGKYHLQILLYITPQDSDNPFKQPFSHSMSCLLDELFRLCTIQEMNTTQHIVVPSAPTIPPAPQSSHIHNDIFNYIKI